MATYRWGILGTGRIAATFADGLKQAATGKLAAVCSRDKAKAAAFAQAHGAAKAYGDFAALLADPDVDAVYVATPHPEHAWACVQLASAGKHILCEKPLALNAADADAVVHAARSNGVVLMEAFMYRCHPQTIKLVELLRAGAIGEPRLLQGAFAFNAGGAAITSRLLADELGGGGILDVGCYPVSLARLVAGATSGLPFANPLSVKGSGVLGTTGVDDYASALLQFSDGFIAEVGCGVRLDRDRRTTIYGTEGKLCIDNPWVPPSNGAQWRIECHRAGKVSVFEETAAKHLYAYEADHFAALIEGAPTTAPGMPVEDTLGNMATLDQWRSELRFQYRQEDGASNRPTIDRLPLRVTAMQRPPYLPLATGNVPCCRLVMGVDNQVTYPKGQVIFDEYFRLGGNSFDTAWQYGGGACERILGHWLHNRGLREQVILITKGAHTPACYPPEIARQLEDSLQRLKSDFVDVYFMHRDNPDVPVGEFMDALNRLWRAGKIRTFGGSNWSMERIEAANAYAAAHGLEPMRAVSNNFSLARMVDPIWPGCVSASEPAFREWLSAKQMPLFAWSSQARGFFTERAGPAKRDDTQLVRCWYADENFERRRRAIELAATLHVEPINIALAYVLSQPIPTAALIGPRTIAELHSTWKAIGIALSPAQLAWLDLAD